MFVIINEPALKHQVLTPNLSFTAGFPSVLSSVGLEKSALICIHRYSSMQSRLTAPRPESTPNPQRSACFLQSPDPRLPPIFLLSLWFVFSRMPCMSNYTYVTISHGILSLRNMIVLSYRILSLRNMIVNFLHIFVWFDHLHSVLDIIPLLGSTPVCAGLRFHTLLGDVLVASSL